MSGSIPRSPVAIVRTFFGRDSFGNVTIVNSDAGAAAYTGSVIDQAHRAVSELLKIGMRHPE